VLEATVGHNYAGAKDVAIGGFGSNDFFGSAVSLDGNRLAIGAFGDDAAGNAVNDSGAVFLLSFTDAVFSGGVLEATIGQNYSTGKNLSISTLGSGDVFGTSVSLDGNRLAVGAYGDDGSGNSSATSGAVYLFSFSDAAFNGAALEATIGKTYSGGKNFDVVDLGPGDQFGAGVSLDGDRLAVGANLDDGLANAISGAGAVYLFTFTDAAFNGTALATTIGAEIVPAGSIDLGSASLLGAVDQFGSAVSLDGNRLAVGAQGDDGAGNAVGASGAVYLFSFADAAFNGGALEAVIGDGYAGGKNIALAQLDASDQFGWSVSLDGNRLAVGAGTDDGSGNTSPNSGAVYLFSFTDSIFSGGALEATIGADYAGGKNVNFQVDDGDLFGVSLSLDGNRLAVGAPGDDGDGNGVGNAGGVHLFSFTDSAFSGGVLEATIGADYAGGKNFDLTPLGGSDNFGASVSLDGNQLAIGADFDDGVSNSVAASGAVYLLSFADAAFNGAGLDATIGHGYAGGSDINLSQLDANDRFGVSVSLDSGRLAAGALTDDGSGNSLSASGVVYLFSLAGGSVGIGDALYAVDPGGDSVITVATLKALLDAGNNVTLQANNDLTLANDLIVANGSGDGGDITFQAGRSILLDGNIFTDNGNLTLIANDLLANGVVDAHRDSGDAVITMVPGTSIDAGTGDVRITLASGAGKTFTAAGDITLNTISAGTIRVEHLNAGDIILNGALTAGTGASPIILGAQGGDFINNFGAGAINPGAGRFLVYSSSPFLNTPGGLVADPYYNTAYNPGAPDLAGVSGDRFVYTLAPQLTVTADNANRDYGDANPAFSAMIAGYINGDNPASTTGTPGFSTPALQSSNVGNYAIAPTIGSLASDFNYQFVFVDGVLTIDPATLTVAANNAARDYGDANPVFSAGITGFKLSDNAGNALTGAPSLTTAATPLTGVGMYAINAAAGSLAANNGNYVFSFMDGVLTIDPAALVITAGSASREYGDANPLLGFSAAGLKNGESEAVLSGIAVNTTALQSSNVGMYATTASGGPGNANYTISSYIDGVLTIDPATLTVIADNQSMLPGTTVPPLTATIDGLKLSDDATILTGLTLSTTATPASTPGGYVITSSGGVAVNYIITMRIDGVLTVEPLTNPDNILGKVTSDADTIVDGDADGEAGEFFDVTCGRNLDEFETACAAIGG